MSLNNYQKPLLTSTISVAGLLFKCWLPLALFFMASCAAPRSVINSGKVTAPKQFKVGMNYGFNVATEPLSHLKDITREAVNSVANDEEVIYEEKIDIFAQAITAYAIDPVGSSYDLYVRYGIAPRFDVGYKYASGAHAFDVMYQFMGSTGTPANPGPEGIYGSVGLQYSTQNIGIGDQFYLDKINNVLKFSADRKDLVIPLIFSKSFGPEEEIGSIAWGVVYNHSFMDYGFEPGNLFRRVGPNEVEKIEGFGAKNNFSAFGGFVNAHIGFKWVYLVPALTLYYQDYGTFQLLEGKKYSYSGFTFIPSLGLQLRFGGNR